MMNYAIRHAMTEWGKENRHPGWADISICDEGRRECFAPELTEKLVKLNPSVIITGDLRRQIQTAENINQKLQKPIIVTDKLREIGMGGLTGMTEAELPVKLLRFYTHQHPEIHGCESMRSVFARALSFGQYLQSRKIDNALCVSSGGFMTMLKMIETTDCYDFDEHQEIYNKMHPKNLEIVPLDYSGVPYLMND